MGNYCTENLVHNKILSGRLSLGVLLHVGQVGAHLLPMGMVQGRGTPALPNPMLSNPSSNLRAGARTLSPVPAATCYQGLALILELGSSSRQLPGQGTVS